MKFNGMGGMGNMQNLMKQAQKMQQELMEKQEKLNSSEVLGSVANGLVQVAMMGDKTIKKITIKPEVVDPNDVEMLEDLIVSAINDAQSKVDELKEEIMGGLPAGMGF